ncbi:EAL domain-containing protein [Pseudofrankia asymbiotica]|uniref:Diguanylate phosphodiesterase n=1 Tax=Pseudofrankia asymbiotica TaxID=1834516 RepID=A0A1V2IDW1_9ACTN|nr:EAL domain-containing protein [Pseudofrankia asymbiotica]ONH31307.1 diguanylate phosphodiesterase [Pseudofrankia asymbiotica]
MTHIDAVRRSAAAGSTLGAPGSLGISGPLGPGGVLATGLPVGLPAGRHAPPRRPAGAAPTVSVPARPASLVPLLAALVAGLARVVTDDGAVTIVEAGAAGAGVAATGVAGWSLWRATAPDRGWLGRLTMTLAGWTVLQAVGVGLGPTPGSGFARATVAAGALAAPLLAAAALVALPRPFPPGLAATRGLGEGVRQAGKRVVQAEGGHAGKVTGAALGARLAEALVTVRRHGWDEAGFDVHYQPIVRLVDGAVVGLEALARWTEPGRGPVSPLTFVAAAEDGGLVGTLDELVLGRACAEVAAVLPATRGVPATRLHVNISASRLGDPALPDVFARAFGASGLDPRRLVVEITETYRIADLAAAARVLEAIRALGPSIAVDDVGAGHTNLAALHELPVSVVKLDRCLIENPLGPGRASRLGRSVITVARSLGAVVVAEGIERRAQRADLALLGCELGQGYLFARPAPLATLAPLLAVAAPVAPLAGSAVGAYLSS